MKVLFLDVDGVLNNANTKERCCNYIGVDVQLASLLLNRLNPDVKIVLSSTWRLHPEMWPALNAAGIKWIDNTPFLPDDDRGNEIQTWLDLHPEVEKYAVLDDNAYNIDELHDNFFIQTNGRVGLTRENIDAVNRLLT